MGGKCRTYSRITWLPCNKYRKNKTLASWTSPLLSKPSPHACLHALTDYLSPRKTQLQSLVLFCCFIYAHLFIISVATLSSYMLLTTESTLFSSRKRHLQPILKQLQCRIWFCITITCRTWTWRWALPCLGRRSWIWMWMCFSNCSVYPILITNSTLLFLEHVNDGTRLMWLICRAAHPMLNSPGNIM